MLPRVLQRLEPQLEPNCRQLTLARSSSTGPIAAVPTVEGLGVALNPAVDLQTAAK
jgi:hypothetical protein